MVRCLQRDYGLEMTHQIISQKIAPKVISMESVRLSAKRKYSGKCHNRGWDKENRIQRQNE